MRKIVYYVASSLDGFIAGPGEDISGFIAQGNGVDRYMKDLESYDTVIMGRKTYEFGYTYGLQAGKRAYPHMEHYIFSQSLRFEGEDVEVHVCERDIKVIDNLKQQEGSHIYLCGGGLFAGWLLENERIDEVKVKLNPFVQGEGIRLFEGIEKSYQLELLDSNTYDGGMQIMTYKVNYS